MHVTCSRVQAPVPVRIVSVKCVPLADKQPDCVVPSLLGAPLSRPAACPQRNPWSTATASVLAACQWLFASPALRDVSLRSLATWTVLHLEVEVLFSLLSHPTDESPTEVSLFANRNILRKDLILRR